MSNESDDIRIARKRRGWEPIDGNVSGMAVDNDTRMATEMVKTIGNCEVRGCPYAGKRPIEVSRETTLVIAKK